MALSETQVFGFIANVLKLLLKQAPALKKGGVDVELVVTNLQSLFEAALAANAHQHEMRRQAKSATTNSVALTRRVYVAGSGILDMAIASVEKNSAAARDFRRLRSRIGRLRDEGEAAPSEPAETA